MEYNERLNNLFERETEIYEDIAKLSSDTMKKFKIKALARLRTEGFPIDRGEKYRDSLIKEYKDQHWELVIGDNKSRRIWRRKNKIFRGKKKSNGRY